MCSPDVLMWEARKLIFSMMQYSCSVITIAYVLAYLSCYEQNEIPIRHVGYACTSMLSGLSLYFTLMY